jgi:hypothetical protein
MQVKPSLLRYRVASIPKDDKGSYEPEQMPSQLTVAREPTQVSLGAGASVEQQAAATPKGAIPTTLSLEMPAGDMARQVRSRCMLCKHFDAEAWKALKRHWESSVEGMELLNKLRGALYLHGDVAMADRHASMEGDQDLEHTLMALGICQVLTEIDHEPCVVYGPFGNCPSASKTGAPVKTEAQPLGYFTPCSADAERVGTANYDSIMRAALGSKP